MVPAGALSASTTISITANPATTAPTHATTLGSPCIFDTGGATLASAATVTLPFTDAQLPSGSTASAIVVQVLPTHAPNAAAYFPLAAPTVNGTTSVSVQATTLGTFAATIPATNCNVVVGYPGNSCSWGVAVGNTFPDIALAGGAALNFATTPKVDSTTNLASSFTFAQLQALSQKANGGFRYAFLDISAVWCPHCNDEAQTLPGTYVPTWLSEGGVIFSILVQSGSTNSEGIYPPASVSDLDAWIAKYNINYPMSLDTQQNMVTATGLNAWPANLIVRLSDMTVIDSVFGATDAFYAEFAGVLQACSTSADCWSGATCSSQGQCQ